MESATQTHGYPGNWQHPNTTVVPAAGALSQRAPHSATAVQLEGLDDDHELYERVLQRVRSTGGTVRLEDVLGQLDDQPAGQPSSD